MRKWFCMNTTINNIHIFKTQEAATVLTILYMVQEIWQYSTNYRSSRPDVFYKKGALRNLVKFTVKYLRQSLFFNKVAIATLLKKRPWRRCFPVNFTKFLRIPFFIEHLWWLLLKLQEYNLCQVWTEVRLFDDYTLSQNFSLGFSENTQNKVFPKNLQTLYIWSKLSTTDY